MICSNSSFVSLPGFCKAAIGAGSVEVGGLFTRLRPPFAYVQILFQDGLTVRVACVIHFVREEECPPVGAAHPVLQRDNRTALELPAGSVERSGVSQGQDWNPVLPAGSDQCLEWVPLQFVAQFDTQLGSVR